MIDSPLFDVRLRRSGRVADRNGHRASTSVVTVSGEVDLATAPELDRMLAQAISSECKEVLVDMAGVEFIDAAGIASLVTGARHAAGAGTHLRLLAPSPAAERVLRLVGLDGALETADEVGALGDT